jgi:Zn-dependent protease with chaperone function
MLMNEAIRRIRAGVHSRLFICVIVILTGYLFAFNQAQPMRLVTGFLFLIATETMIFLWVPFITKMLSEPFSKQTKTNWDYNPIFDDFRVIAENEHVTLNKKRPFGIKPDLDNAYANSFSGQIVLGSKLMNRLTHDEVMAVFGHELTHLKKNHASKTILFTAFIPFLVALPLMILKPGIVHDVVYYAIFFVTFVVACWHNEYDADAGASAIAGRLKMVRVLDKLSPRQTIRTASETHPSPYSRILKLRSLHGMRNK